MNRPWFQMYSRDWLDNKELRRCSPTARAVLTDLMCLAHEGKPYGFLQDKVGPLTIKYMASRCVVTPGQFLKSIAELKSAGGRLSESDGVLFIPRMVEDERVRSARAAGGSKGGNPNLANKVNLPPNLDTATEGYPHSRARTRADSECVSENGFSKNEKPSLRFEEFWERWPRKFGKDAAAVAWTSVVTTENEAAVFACLDRFLASGDCARGAVPMAGQTREKQGWIFDCARDGWQCDWPKAQLNGVDSKLEARRRALEQI